ncbi:hypothetical protein AVEN_38926-1, partial [Araneus ventricosus]
MIFGQVRNRDTLPAALARRKSISILSLKHLPEGRVSVYSPCSTCQKEEYRYTLPAALAR